MLTSFKWSWGSKLFWQRYVTDSLISEILVPTPPNHSVTTVCNCFGHPGLHFSGLLWKCPGFACQRLLVCWQIVFEMCVCNCFWCFWSRVMSEVSSVGDQCLSDRSSRVLDQSWRQKGLEQKRDRSVEAGERKPRSSRCIIRRRISSKSILARRISISLHCKGDIHIVFGEKNSDHIYLFHNMSRLCEGIHPSFIQRCASIACMRSKMSKSSFERKICSSLFLSNFGDIWVTFKPQTVTLDLRTRNGDGSSQVQIKFRNLPLLGFFSDGDFWMM